jgi:hypothetical protein
LTSGFFHDVLWREIHYGLGGTTTRPCFSRYGKLISILGFFERVNERTADVLVIYMNALTGGSANGTSSMSQDVSAESGVLDDVLGFLSSRRDKSGVSAVLVK